ncbi:hypothetical protein PoB_005892000 [Plakobranchus ocellatus]|uniref:Uncharacterized protein n=1 Tax=Plakobranchus ocellatus TaxID=259542 RepID=A0AAV4CL52_9GAST|nr:hypothetical protein PoB_005892000 [Plakobranchus ocellatus]
MIIKVVCSGSSSSRGGVGGTVATNPPRDLQGPFCRGFEPRHRRPGLTEGLKARDHLDVDWLNTKPEIDRMDGDNTHLAMDGDYLNGLRLVPALRLPATDRI